MKQRWLRAAGSAAAICAALACQDVHWGLLQSIAWARMLLEYSDSYGLTRGVKYTFDGEHPCPLCKRIQQAQADAGADDRVMRLPPPTDLRCTLPAFARVPGAAGTRSPLSRASRRWEGRLAEQPPVPPPRVRV